MRFMQAPQKGHIRGDRVEQRGLLFGESVQPQRFKSSWPCASWCMVRSALRSWSRFAVPTAASGPAIGGNPYQGDGRTTRGQARQGGLLLLQDLVNISIDAAALGEARGHGAHDVLMAVREEDEPEELFGFETLASQFGGRRDISGVRIRVGESMDIAGEIINRRGGSMSVRDQVRAIQRLAVPDGHREKFQLRLIGEEGRAADPGAIQLARYQQRRDFLISAPGYELNGTPRGFFQIGLEQIEEV